MSANKLYPITNCRSSQAAGIFYVAESRESAEMRKMTFAVYNPPKEGLPYLSTVIAPTGAVAAVAYQTAAEAEDHNLKLAMETAKGVE